MQGEIDQNTVRREDILFSAYDSQVIKNKERSINKIFSKFDSLDINQILHLANIECIFFSSIHGAFTKIHLLGHQKDHQ